MKNLIFGPLITEKSIKDAEGGKFTFRVSVEANKDSLRKVIENKFKVDILNIYTQIVKPKKKRTLQRTYTMTPFWKKAIVEVAKGQKISLFDFATGKDKK